MALMSIGELAKNLGVSVVTLRRWHRAGRLLPACRTEGGHRRYDTDAVNRQFGLGGRRPTKTLVYARVSSHDQKAQLDTQAERLRQPCHERGWLDVEVVKDLGSGMNCSKKGLLYLLRQIVTRQIARLVLVTKDRLLRFGADLILQLCKLSNVEVVILDEAGDLSKEQQLVADLISIVTVFSSKLYGSRSRKNLKAVDRTTTCC